MNQQTVFKNLLFTGILAFLLSSCDKVCTNGSGSVQTESRDVSGFTSVTQEIDATLYITQASEFSVSIDAQQNILDEIKTDVSGGQLKIYSNHCFTGYEPIKIYVSMPDVEGMKISGTGAIYTQNKFNSNSMTASVSGSGNIFVQDSIITSNNLSLSISGSGDINFLGTASSTSASISGSGNITMVGGGNSSDINISGSGSIHGFDFPVNDCTIKISGSGNVEATVFNSLNATISGSGDIYYKGNPTVTVSVSGSGKLIHQP